MGNEGAKVFEGGHEQGNSADLLVVIVVFDHLQRADCTMVLSSPEQP
jgi:hypothetical protein